MFFKQVHTHMLIYVHTYIYTPIEYAKKQRRQMYEQIHLTDIAFRKRKSEINYRPRFSFVGPTALKIKFSQDLFRINQEA